jgi:hypothetical protein
MTDFGCTVRFYLEPHSVAQIVLRCCMTMCELSFVENDHSCCGVVLLCKGQCLMSLPERVSGFATAAGNFFHFVHSHLTFHLAISFFPHFSGSYWWDVGLNWQIPSVLSLWSQFADPGWPQGCSWSYIMLMGEVQGTFRGLCWIMGIWGCVRLCGSCGLNTFVRHINPIQETWNWVCCTVWMDYIGYSFFFLCCRNWN